MPVMISTTRRETCPHFFERSKVRVQITKKELLTEEVVELLTAPADLATYKAAITEALYKGTRRNIESEADPKNAVVG